MSSWKGICSQLGNHWAIEVKPGSDTSFKEVVPGIPPCFGVAEKLEFIRKMDVLGAKDGNAFSTKMVVDRDEYIADFRADASLLLLLEQVGKCRTKEEIEKLFSTNVLENVVGCKGGIDLWTVQEILRSDTSKLLDSTIISLYTKENNSIEIGESYWVVGTKDVEEALRCAAEHSLAAKQEINLPLFRMEGTSYISLSFKAPVTEKMILDAGIQIKGNKHCVTTCKIGSEAVFGIGWALQGYGEGGYGL